MAIVTSDVSASASVTVTNTDWWLKDPLDPSLNMTIPVDAASPISFHKPEDITFHKALGRTTRLWTAGEILGDEFTLNLVFTTDSAWSSFQTLRANQRTLLVQSDDEEQWYVRLGGDQSVSYHAVAGRTSGKALRRVSVPAIEDEKP